MVDDSGTDPVKKCAQTLREDETERKEISTIKTSRHFRNNSKSTQQPRY